MREPIAHSPAKLTALYQERILEHFRRPRNKRVLAHPTAAAERTIPVCGDEVRVELAVAGDRVRDAAFTGQLCSVAQASASMMTDAIRGTTCAEALGLAARVEAMVRGDPPGTTPAPAPDGELRALASVAGFPARVPCALLPWAALRDALPDALPDAPCEA